MSSVVLSSLVALGFPGPARAADGDGASEDASRRVENAVVQVFATLVAPDLIRPWSKEPPREVTGSGVVIEGKRILTNAHLVLYASRVEVQANRSGDKLSATVKAVAPGIDLALLELEDPKFFDTHPPLPRASALPSIRESVLAYRFPTGGTRSRSPRGSSHASSSSVTTASSPACASRSTLRSTPATAAARRSSATR